MELTPNAVLNSFLAQAQKLKMAVVVFAGFIDGGSARFISKHTLREGTEKAFLGKFLATDDAAVEAAAKSILSSLLNMADDGVVMESESGSNEWADLPDEAKDRLRQAAKTAIEAARDPERPKILATPS